MREYISMGIAICSLIVSIIVMLWGNSLLGRMDKVETQTKEIKETIEKILSPPVNQPKPPMPSEGREIIHFYVPIAFRCGADLQWNDLQDWSSFVDKQLCSNEDVYRVKGAIVGYEKGMTLAAEIYVPEADRWFPASGGGIIIPDSNGSFSADFCLQTRGPDRTFKFKLVQNGRSIGECGIHISGI